jgi:hypothetical protein
MLWRIIIGHILVIGGCYLTAWGFTLLPQSSPAPLDIFMKPLFWGLVVIMAGVCTLVLALKSTTR